jgi:hypothetical protein
METASPALEASTSDAARLFASAIRGLPCSSIAAMLSESSRRSPTAAAAFVTALAGVKAGRAKARTISRSASVEDQEENLAEPDATDLARFQGLQETRRGERHLRQPPPAQEMEQDRNRRRGERPEEARIQER